MLEGALAQLPDVAVRVEGLPEPPGWGWAWSEGERRFEGHAALADEGLRLRLCDEAGDCVVAESTYSETRARVREAVERVGAWMKLEPPAAADGAVSDDPGALRGFSRAARDAFRGGRPWAGLRWERLDRVVRADPGLGEAWTLLGRRAARGGDLEVASMALAHAADLGGSAADAAAVWVARGHGDRVARLGRTVDRRDPRIAALVAVASCVHPAEVEPRLEPECIDRLPAPVRGAPALLRLQAGGTEAPGARLDRLEAWARAEEGPEAAEAARQAALEAMDWERALALDVLVADKGGAAFAGPARARLEHAVRGPDARAEERARRLARRGSLVVARARAALDAGEVRAALALADERLGAEEFDADALAIRARALAELGRNPEAQAALVALEAADPMAPDAAMVRRLLRGR